MSLSRPQTMPSNFVMVDPYFVPFTPEEWDRHTKQFLEQDAGNGKYIECGQHRIYENGAVFHLVQGKERGPLPKGTPAYSEHRRKYIGFRENELKRLKDEYQRKHRELTNRIKHSAMFGGDLSETIEAEIDALRKETKTIRCKEAELEKLKAPEREWEAEESHFRKGEELRRFGYQDRAARLLRRLGPNPFDEVGDGGTESALSLGPASDEVQEMIDGNATIHRVSD